MDDEQAELWEWLRQGIEEQKTREAEQLAKARTEAEKSGKEPFDFEKLENLVDLRPYSTDYGWVPTPEYILSYEYKYYVLHPEFTTIEEFARFVEMMRVMMR